MSSLLPASYLPYRADLFWICSAGGGGSGGMQ
jgi:hypothetical protein